MPGPVKGTKDGPDVIDEAEICSFRSSGSAIQGSYSMYKSDFTSEYPSKDSSVNKLIKIGRTELLVEFLLRNIQLQFFSRQYSTGRRTLAHGIVKLSVAAPHDEVALFVGEFVMRDEHLPASVRRNDGLGAHAGMHSRKALLS